MKYKLKTLDNGKEIHIYDELFTYWQRDIWYQVFLNAPYHIAASDHHLLESQSDYNFGTVWTLAQLEQLGILSHPALAPYMGYFDGFNILQARANLSTPGDSNRFHSDMQFPNEWLALDSYKIPRDSLNEVKTFIYYVNLQWDLYWGGYTLFANDAIDEIELGIMYNPGRVIMFDGSIPHCVSPPWIGCPTVRWTFAVQFVNETHTHSTKTDGPIPTPFGEYT